MNKTRLIAIVALVVGLGGSSFLSTRVAASVGRHELSYADQATDGDRPEVALGIAMGAFRGLFVNFLWMRANSLKEEGLFHESIELAKVITKLQPRFPRVWVFHAWNLAYNVSVETQTPGERWQWVQSGVRLLRDEGIPANPNDMFMHKELSWIFLHKIGGYTDDSNRYYKRKVAEEWTEVVGPPPPAATGEETRDDLLRRYDEEWLGPIANAPATIEAVIEFEPTVAELVERLGEVDSLLPFDVEISVLPGKGMLRLLTLHEHIAESVERGRFEEGWGEGQRLFEELRIDPAYTDAWAVLVPHVRKRVIIDDYNMSPKRMIDYTYKHGPLDWRVPAAHALYWAQLGVDRGGARVTQINESNYDFVNTYRLVAQSLQELFRYGDVYFSYLDFVSGKRAYYQGFTNPYFAQSYGEIAEEVAERGGIFESASRVRTAYNAGYENFLMDVVLFFYRRGQIAEANYWRLQLINNPRRNIADPELSKIEESMPLDDYVELNLFDRLSSPHVATQQVFGAIQGAMVSLLRGETDRFRSQIDFAQRFHEYYVREQGFEVTATGGTDARMLTFDRNFRNVVGGVAAAFMTQIDIDDAVLLYNRMADNAIRRYLYDQVRGRFEPIADAGEPSGGDPFEIMFPEPEGMAEFRAIQAERERRLGEQREAIEVQ
ncbi:MAG: hypothetical protein AAF235_07430 [Planctomycetota bacterium]